MDPRSKYNFNEREARQAFYQSKEWHILRQYILRTKPLCVYCERKGIIREAVVCDHVVDLRIDPTKRLSPSNIQPLCKECHDKKSARDAVNSELDLNILNRKWKINVIEIPKRKSSSIVDTTRKETHIGKKK